MRKTVLVICFTSLVLAVLTTACWSKPVIIKEYRIPTTGENGVFRPRISGDWVMINRIGKYNIPVLAVDVYNIKTKQLFTANQDGDLPWCEFSDNNILWVKRGLFLFDVTTMEQRVINAPNNPANATIWQNYVAYEGGNRQIYLLDTITGKSKMISRGSGRYCNPEIGPDVVVWSDCSDPKLRQLFAYRISTGGMIDIPGDPQINYMHARTDGKTIICQLQPGGIMAFDIDSGSWIPISSKGYFPDVDQGIVVFVEKNVVYGYELSTNTKFRISNTPKVTQGPSIDNLNVIWGCEDGVYLAEIGIPINK